MRTGKKIPSQILHSLWAAHEFRSAHIFLSFFLCRRMSAMRRDKHIRAVTCENQIERFPRKNNGNKVECADSFGFAFFFVVLFIFTILLMPLAGAPFRHRKMIVKSGICFDSNARLITHSDQMYACINNIEQFFFAGNTPIKINKRQNCGFCLDYVPCRRTTQWRFRSHVATHRGNWIPLRLKFLRNDLLNHTFFLVLLLLGPVRSVRTFLSE